MGMAPLRPAPLTLAVFLALAIPAVLLHDPASRASVGLALVAVMIPGILLVLLAHELGHVAAGLLRGFEFVALICGPLAVSRVDGRLRPEWNRAWSLYGGIAILAPTGGRLPPRRDALVLFAGGPLASLALGTLFVALHYGLELDGVTRRTIVAGTHTFPDLLAGAFTMMVGLSSLLVAVATMIPNAVGGFTSDGAAIRMLLKGGPEADRLQALNALIGAMHAGQRPREWSAELVARAAAVRDGSALESAAASFAHVHALDSGDVAAARGHLARMQAAGARAPAITTGELRLAEAWLAVADGRTAEARSALDASAGTLVEEYDRRRVLAAILLADGKAADGTAAAREGLELMAKEVLPFPGLAAMQREWLTELAAGRLPAVLTAAGAR